MGRNNCFAYLYHKTSGQKKRGNEGERHTSNAVLQLEWQTEELEHFLSAKHGALWASWLRPEQQNTGLLAWRQRNTSLLIRPRSATETKEQVMEVCSASQAICRYLIIAYARRRSGFSRGRAVSEYSWDEKAGRRMRTAALSCTLWSKRSGWSELEAAGSQSLDVSPVLQIIKWAVKLFMQLQIIQADLFMRCQIWGVPNV